MVFGGYLEYSRECFLELIDRISNLLCDLTRRQLHGNLEQWPVTHMLID